MHNALFDRGVVVNDGAGGSFISGFKDDNAKGAGVGVEGAPAQLDDAGFA